MLPELNELLQQKITQPEIRENIIQAASVFAPDEIQLLIQILQNHEFDTPELTQSFNHAVNQQYQLHHTPAHHHDDDESSIAVCSHCVNPPIPPLRDYEMWRQQQKHKKPF